MNMENEIRKSGRRQICSNWNLLSRREHRDGSGTSYGWRTVDFQVMYL